MDMEVIGYTRGGSTVVSIPDLWELEQRGVEVDGMIRAADGALILDPNSHTAPGYAIVNEYHPVGYAYRSYRRLLEDLEYAGKLTPVDTYTEFCGGKQPKYEYNRPPRSWEGHCKLCGKSHTRGYAADGHQFGWLFA